MLIAEADIRTEWPSWYLAQLCEYPSALGGDTRHRPHMHHGGHAPTRTQHVERGNTHGTIDLVGGRCTLRADTNSLTLRVEAADPDSLQRIQHLVAARMQEIGQHDALHVTWRQTEPSGHQLGDPTTDTPVSAKKAGPHTPRRAALGLLAVVALVVAVHLGLGSLLMASGSGTHWIIGAVLVITLLHVLGSLVVRRRKSRRTR
ncbi:DUF2218 domain-containing protein [Streptomyces chromofuscus]|uniref:DUF2218 domain-containing protein n=1 Tax=Streptomyces chromofuscus TaxID=42881 RepID=A0A7M2T9F8_STRCW|nr:DUF2218 domain-containing protein [Streptomyces chromofuscus]QOV44553.1 DUF2218 domain-containing protein [Streptomyces chromofuscus]GGT02306.1 hypothetical protein GCM10010254_23460 [Streptomyces chromofuscus]